MAEGIINWINTILTLLLSTSVSLGANKVIVEHNQKMRLHSEKLVDLSFKKWPEAMNNIANRGSEYEDEIHNDYVPFSAKSLGVPHAEFLISHMESGYKDDWDKWTALLNCASEYSNFQAQLKNMILADIIEFADKKEIKFFYHKVGRDTPKQYIRPKYVVDKVMAELDYRYKGYEGEWFGNNVVVHRSTAKPYYSVIFDNEVARIFSGKKANYIFNSIKKIPAIETIHKKYDELMEIEKRYDEIHGSHYWRIEKIISEIELGLNIKGNCKACPKWF